MGQSVCYAIISRTSINHSYRIMTLSMTVKPSHWCTINHLFISRNGMDCQGKSMLTSWERLLHWEHNNLNKNTGSINSKMILFVRSASPIQLSGETLTLSYWTVSTSFAKPALLHLASTILTTERRTRSHAWTTDAQSRSVKRLWLPICPKSCPKSTRNSKSRGRLT